MKINNTLKIIITIFFSLLNCGCIEDNKSTPNPTSTVSLNISQSPSILQTTSPGDTTEKIPISKFKFGFLAGIGVDKDENLYISDYDNHKIYKITSDGYVISLAGNGQKGFNDGKGNDAMFNSPTNMAIDNNGNIYVIDSKNYSIRKITPDGMTTTLAGNGKRSQDDKNSPFYGNLDAITIDKDENIYVLDTCSVKKIPPDGLLTRLAIQEPANNFYPWDSGQTCHGLTIDNKGNIFISNQGSKGVKTIISKLTPDGFIRTLAGKDKGDKDGSGEQASFDFPIALAADKDGNIYVADYENNKIRKITPDGMVTTFAGSGEYGFKDGNAKEAMFKTPQEIAVDKKGNVYVIDRDGKNILFSRIKKITPDGYVTTIASGGEDLPGPIPSASPSSSVKN